MQVIRVRLVSSEKTEGCKEAPIEILKELRNLGCSQDFKKIDVNVLSLEEIHVDLDDVEEANHLIFENSKEIFEKSSKAFFVGGDHSITYPIVKAFKKVEENPLLVAFDAHGGCKDSLSEGWLRKLVDEGLPGSKIVLVSTRNLAREELDFIRENEITVIGMDVLNEDLVEVCDLIMERARKSKGFYVSIDIDSVDPSFAPGTADLEPGGLTSREIIYFVKRLSLLENFRGAEIVNVNPSLDLNKMTVKLGTRLLGEMIVNC